MEPGELETSVRPARELLRDREPRDFIVIRQPDQVGHGVGTFCLPGEQLSDDVVSDLEQPQPQPVDPGEDRGKQERAPSMERPGPQVPNRREEDSD